MGWMNSLVVWILGFSFGFGFGFGGCCCERDVETGTLRDFIVEEEGGGGGDEGESEDRGWKE